MRETEVGCEICVRRAVKILTEPDEEGETVGRCETCGKCGLGDRDDPCQALVEYRVEWPVESVGGDELELYRDACAKHAFPDRCCAKTENPRRLVPFVAA